MKGWVYVISNKAMQGLVKVGFSTKVAEERAAELNHTGSPHPYVVEYEMLIENPYEIEQKTHQLLSSKREGKEWFRASAEEAVAAIKQVSGTRAIFEIYTRVERAKAEALQQQDLAAIELRRRQERERKELEERLHNEEAIIRKTFDSQTAALFPPHPFWVYWLGGSVLVGIALAIINPPKMSDSGAFVFSAIFGSLVGWWLQEYFENKRKRSSSYVALEKQMREELAAARVRVSSLLSTQQIAPGNSTSSVETINQKDLERLKKAASEGLTEAQNELGSLYYLGKGVQQDYALARGWYEQAAAHGNAKARYMLGSLYYMGHGVPQDYAIARHWYEKAAVQGNAQAQAFLADLYRKGLGVPQDYVRAYMWYQLAAANGEKKVADCRDELAEQMSASQIVEAQQLAQEWIHLRVTRPSGMPAAATREGPDETNRAPYAVGIASGSTTSAGRAGIISRDDFATLKVEFPELAGMLAKDLSGILAKTTRDGSPAPISPEEFVTVNADFPGLGAMLANDLSGILTVKIPDDKPHRISKDDFATLKVEFPELAGMLAKDLNWIFWGVAHHGESPADIGTGLKHPVRPPV